MAAGIVLVAVALIACLFFYREIRRIAEELYAMISDRQRVQDFIAASGEGAPVVLIALQILQVVSRAGTWGRPRRSSAVIFSEHGKGLFSYSTAGA